MKTFLRVAVFVVTVSTSNTLIAQAVYNITSDITVSGAKMPSQCENCIINISSGVTLTINQEIYLKNTTFNGGTVLANKAITFWSDGGFNGTTVNVKNNSSITSSGILNINNSSFTFSGNSIGTFWAAVNMNASKMTLVDNAGMVATNVVNLANYSSLVAGDGTSTSKAYIKFDGGTLNEYDNSFVSLQNYNNYYYNWNNYYSVSNNKSFKTTNNAINCGTAGKNTCTAQYLYGPATLNYAGVASSAILPVKLSNFAVKLSGTAVNIAWTTDMETSSSRFEIERSLDGVNWTKIATVKAKGNSSITFKYSYTDVLKLTGNVNYRLKMVDVDESSAYSPIRSVKAEGAATTMNIYPNPSTSYVVINSGSNTNKNVQLINQNGQVIKQVTGTNSINLSVTEFNSGNYFVRVVDAAGPAQTFKLMISK